MTSILDIDLDYFQFVDAPLDRLNDLLGWANRPVDRLVEHHQESLEYWVQISVWADPLKNLLFPLKIFKLHKVFHKVV